MLLLIFGLVGFFSLHILPVTPSLRQALITRVGRGVYFSAFGALATLSLLLIILGWHQRDYIFIYAPPAWGWYLNSVLNLAAAILLAIFLFRGSWRRWLRFSFEYGVMLWAMGHLLVNGDLMAIILFGGMFMGMGVLVFIGVRNKRYPAARVALGHNGLSLLAGIAIYGLMTQLHYAIIGVPIY